MLLHILWLRAARENDIFYRFGRKKNEEINEQKTRIKETTSKGIELVILTALLKKKKMHAHDRQFHGPFIVLYSIRHILTLCVL